jgi:phosphoketolase
MRAYWRGHGFDEVVLVDAKDFDDSGQEGAYVDSTRFSHEARLTFTRAVLEGVDRAASCAMGGKLTVFIIKQLKGAGVHAEGAKSHNLHPGDTLDKPHISDALERRALPLDAWHLVQTNFERAGGGPAGRTVVTEHELELASLGSLPVNEYATGEQAVPSTAMGALVAAVGEQDPRYIVTNADGNEASGMANINVALQIRHPTADALYHQGPTGRVYEPLSEDACAGLAAGLCLFGSRALWLSYESFAINGLPIVQTVTQAMAELRRRTPSMVMMFTAGALEQGRNGWTHQRPEVENYFAAMMRNGNVFPLFPSDANMIQAAYEWALGTWNKGIAIFGSKTGLAVHTTMDQARQAIREGAVTLYDTGDNGGVSVVFAVTGDMVLKPVFEAKDLLEADGHRVRIVAVANPRRLYRPTDVAWSTVSQPDDDFMGDASFDALFHGDVLLGVTGGASGTLEPVMLRSRAARRDVFSWQRGETTASPGEMMAFNGLTGDAMADRARALMA